MTIIEIILIAVALSVDSFAVSMSGSVSLGTLDWKKACRVACGLALIQTVFLCGGLFFGKTIGVLVSQWGRYIGFSILLCLGINMIRESHKTEEEEESRDLSSLARIFSAGVATSIDAVAAGASLGLSGISKADVWFLSAATAVATALFCVGGMVCGIAIGRKFGQKSKFAAGIVLIAIGIRILLQ